MEISQPLHVMQALIELASQMPPAATSAAPSQSSNSTTPQVEVKRYINVVPILIRKVLTTSTPLTQNLTVNVALVDCVSKTVISKGLQGGDVRVWRAGQNSMTINGLKLSKMNPIKAELHTKNSKHSATDFFLQFQIGESIVINSIAFKLVSSCSQLPNNIRENVRPFKKMLSTEGKSSSETEEPVIPVKKQKVEATSSSESLETSPPRPQQQHPQVPILPNPVPAQDFNFSHNNNNTSIAFPGINKIQLPPVKHFIPNDIMQKMRLELDGFIMAGDPENAARAASQLACIIRMHNYQ